MHSLTLETRQLLQTAQTKLKRQDPCMVCQTSQRRVRALLDWCALMDVPVDDDIVKGRLTLSKRLIDAIEQVLLELSHPPLDAQISGLSSYQQAEQGVTEDKSRRCRPTDRRLQLVMQAFSTSTLLNPQENWHLDVALDDINWSNVSCLLMIENLDVFYAFRPSKVSWLSAWLGEPLCIYRGHNYLAKGALQAVKIMKKQNKPCLYWGDCDASGLEIALDLEMSHFVLPASWLTDLHWQQRGDQQNRAHQRLSKMVSDGLWENRLVQTDTILLARKLQDRGWLQQWQSQDQSWQLLPLFADESLPSI